MYRPVNGSIGNKKRKTVRICTKASYVLRRKQRSQLCHGNLRKQSFQHRQYLCRTNKKKINAPKSEDSLEPVSSWRTAHHSYCCDCLIASFCCGMVVIQHKAVRDCALEYNTSTHQQQRKATSFERSRLRWLEMWWCVPPTVGVHWVDIFDFFTTTVS